MSFKWRMSIFCESYSKTFLDNGFVNKSVKLSLDLIWQTSIKSSFCRSYVEKNFDEICLVLSHLIYHPLIWAMHAILSSYNIIGLFLIDFRLHSYWMYWIIDLNQTHSRPASYRAINSAWFDDVIVSVCFVGYHEIAVPPYINTYSDCDRVLCEYVKYPASAYPTNLDFLSFW
jgi:uncharacterized membrane protein